MGAAKIGVPDRSLFHGGRQTVGRSNDLPTARDTGVEGINSRFNPVPEGRTAKSDFLPASDERPASQAVVPNAKDPPTQWIQQFVDEFDTFLASLQVSTRGIQTGGPCGEAQIVVRPGHVLARILTAQEFRCHFLHPLRRRKLLAAQGATRVHPAQLEIDHINEGVPVHLAAAGRRMRVEAAKPFVRPDGTRHEDRHLQPPQMGVCGNQDGRARRLGHTGESHLEEEAHSSIDFSTHVCVTAMKGRHVDVALVKAQRRAPILLPKLKLVDERRDQCGRTVQNLGWRIAHKMQRLPR